MEKYRGKTLDEWREYIKKDEQTGIRTTKYIIVLEEIIEELLSKMNQLTVSEQLFCSNCSGKMIWNNLYETTECEDCGCDLAN